AENRRRHRGHAWRRRRTQRVYCPGAVHDQVAGMRHPANCETVLWLVRHPEPDEAVRGVCYGSFDVVLSPRGIEQAQSIARRLSSQRFDAIYTSPRKRCVETARNIAGGRSCAVELVDSLRELNFGDFEGRPYDEIAECYPDLYREWMEHPTEVQFP